MRNPVNAVAFFSSVILWILSSLPATCASTPGRPSPVEIVPSSPAGSTTEISLSSDGRFALLPASTAIELWSIEKQRLIRRFHGLSSLADAVAIAPDGKRIAGAANSTIIIWDAITGHIEGKIEAGLTTVRSMVFSQDGRRLIYAGAKEFSFRDERPLFFIREIASKRVVSSYTDESIGGSSVSISSDGRVVAVGTYDGAIRLSDDRGGSPRTLHADVGSVRSLELSSDGRLLAVGGSKGAKVVDTITRNALLATNSGTWGTVSLSSDKSLLVLREYDTNLVQLWDIQNRKMLRELKEEESVHSLKFLRDGKSILVNGKRRVDINSMKVVAEFGLKLERPSAVNLPSDRGEVLIRGSTTQTSYSVNILDGTVKRALDDRAAPSNWHAVVSSRDGSRLVGQDHSFTLIEKSRGQPSRKIEGFSMKVKVFDVSPDGTLAVGANDEKVELVDIDAGLLRRSIQVKESVSPTLAFSPDGKAIIVQEKGSLRVWNVTTGEQRSANLRWRASFGDDTYDISQVVFFPDGRSFLALPEHPYHGSVEIWSLDGPHLSKRIRVLDREGMASGASISANGNVALIGSYDSLVRAIDVRTGKVKQVYRGLSGPPDSPTFALNGRRVVAADNGSLGVWNAETGELLSRVLISKDGDWIAITSEGFFNASLGGAKLLSMVRGLEVYSIDQVYNALYRPDLVREKLAGDPNGKVKAAAAQLDLDKVMASGVVPKVAITSPASGTPSSVDEVEVRCHDCRAGRWDRQGGVARQRRDARSSRPGALSGSIAAVMVLCQPQAPCRRSSGRWRSNRATIASRCWPITPRT